jgi:hypothetical protein
MTAKELAATTKQFDDPNYRPIVRKPSKRALAELQRVQRRSAANRPRSTARRRSGPAV